MPAVCLVAVAVLAAACRQDMQDQPRYEPLEASSFFEDGRASRPLVPGTVARDDVRADTPFYTGKSGGTPVNRVPIAVTRQVLLRGRERYDIFCAPCHDRVGSGRGMVVRRGFRPPPSFHIDRLREAPVGHFFEVMTHGSGAMADYAAQVSRRDRWAIAAYIRALQLSQRATLADVPAARRRELRGIDQ
jgi:hypothetical protein